MNWYKNKRISTKLIIGFLIVAFIAVIVGGVGILNITSLGNSSSILYEQNALGLEYTGNAATTFQMVRYNTLRLTTYYSTEEINENSAYIKDLHNQLDSALTELDGVVYTTEGKGYLSTIKTEWENYKTECEVVIALVQASNQAQAMTAIEDKVASIGALIRDNLTSLMHTVSTNASIRDQSNKNLATTSVLIMGGVAAAGLLISIILGMYISRMIGNPLKEMAVNARKLALGDVDFELKVDSKDEVGELANAFGQIVAGRKRQVQETHQLADGDLTVDIHVTSEQDVLGQSLSNLVDNLNDVVVSIMASAEQVASGANLVSDSSLALSQGATEQASSVEQLTASLQEVASQTTISTKNAQSANELARLAKKDAEDGNEQMKDMLAAMEAINVSSGSIGKIIKVIDDIAFQTNILALNAAVEAARAGQHGKGFAVVAEEVRTLAARSAQAAKETTDLIEGSIKKVADGTKIANETASALGKIVGEVASAAELVEEIAYASNEQAAAIAQINQGILQVSQVVQNNAATSEESAAASEELSSQAAQLKETIGIFQVRQGRHSTGGRAAISAPKSKISLGEDNFGKY